MAVKNKAPTLSTFADIQYAIDEANLRLGRFLEQLGWAHISGTPGCIWMYEKKIPDGRTILCDADTARAFEEELCGEEWDDVDDGSEPG